MPAEGDPIRCCIAGGGPAGMMLATLLARAGVDVLVLEKHADFLRDFRGDTIHPSTLEIMHELGWLDAFLELPHQKVSELRALVGSLPVTVADFRHLPTRCKFVAFMPQWDFLNFLTLRAARYPGFRLWMRAEATDLLEESGRVVGVRVSTGEGQRDVRADLVVAADGRHSVLRERAAHAMSPVGGVGINLAIQDAVAAANLLAGPLAERRVTVADLDRVQRRRELPTRVIQRFQVIVQKRVIGAVLGATAPPRPPLLLRLLLRLPWLPRLPARLIGLGIRPEHVRTPEAPLNRAGRAG